MKRDTRIVYVRRFNPTLTPFNPSKDAIICACSRPPPSSRWRSWPSCVSLAMIKMDVAVSSCASRLTLFYLVTSAIVTRLASAWSLISQTTSTVLETANGNNAHSPSTNRVILEGGYLIYTPMTGGLPLVASTGLNSLLKIRGVVPPVTSPSKPRPSTSEFGAGFQPSLASVDPPAFRSLRVVAIRTQMTRFLHPRSNPYILNPVLPEGL